MKLNYFTLIFQKYNANISAEILTSTTEEQRRRWTDTLLRESAYMTEYILRAMNREFSFDCKRINFICTNHPLRDGVRKIGSVHEIDVPFNIEYFFFSDKQKEAYLFEVLYEGLKILCKAKEWDFALFEKHLLSLRDRGFSVEFYLDKKRCKREQTVAIPFGVQTMHETTFYMDFFQKRKLVLRKPLMITRTESMLYNYKIDHMAWIDDNTVAVYDYPETNVVYVNMDD